MRPRRHAESVTDRERQMRPERYQDKTPLAAVAPLYLAVQPGRIAAGSQGPAANRWLDASGA
jgi:hypothetical protein